jgi:hypothetical protein
MNVRPKRLPRLWCALQGLLPFDARLAAQRGELVWPQNPPVDQKAKPARRSVTAPGRRSN